MAHKCITSGQLCLSGIFTFSAKCGAALRNATCLGRASIVFLAPALAGPAAASSEIAPTSSASANISVSVAPTYGLRNDGSPVQAHAGAGQAPLCMATNGQPMLLPILLIQSDTGPSMETIRRIPWCGPGRADAELVAKPGAGGPSTLIIVRPE